MTDKYVCIDPELGNDTALAPFNTQAEAEAAPVRTWEWALRSGHGVIAANRNFLLGRRGKTAHENILVPATGNAGSEQVYGAYGEATYPYHIMDAPDTAKSAFQASAKAYITVQDWEVIGGGGSGMVNFVGSNLRGPNFCRVLRLYLHDSLGITTQGVRFGTGTDTPPGPWGSIYGEDILIRRVQGGGVDVIGAIGGNFYRVVAEDCNQNTDNNHWGLHTQPSMIQFGVGSETLLGGSGPPWIFEFALPAGAPVVNVSFARSTFGEFRLNPGTFSTLNVKEYAVQSNVLRCRFSENISLITAGEGFKVRAAQNLLQNINWYDCIVRRQLAAQPGGGDGTGCGPDSLSETVKFIRCRSEFCQGNGFSINDADNGCELLENFALNNGKYGIQASKGRGLHRIAENTVRGSGVAAFNLNDIGASGLVGAQVALRGNLCLKGSGASVVGLLTDGATNGWIEEGNVRDILLTTPGFISSAAIADPTVTYGGLPYPQTDPGGGTTTGEPTDYWRVPRNRKNAGALVWTSTRVPARALY